MFRDSRHRRNGAPKYTSPAGCVCERPTNFEANMINASSRGKGMVYLSSASLVTIQVRAISVSICGWMSGSEKGLEIILSKLCVSASHNLLGSCHSPSLHISSWQQIRGTRYPHQLLSPFPQGQQTISICAPGCDLLCAEPTAKQGVPASSTAAAKSKPCPPSSDKSRCLPPVAFRFPREVITIPSKRRRGRGDLIKALLITY